MNPAISIVIPTFDRALFLKEAIDSVLAQTFKEWELFVIDDGSTDDTKELLSTYKDPRVGYFYQENSGVARARNFGVSLSHSPIISFLDSDDMWLPKKLETQLEYFENNPGISICQTEEVWIRNGRRVNPCAKHKKHSGYIFKECLPLCIVSPSAVAMKREVFEKMGGFDESFPACEDYELWLRASLRYEIHTLEESLIIKRGGHEDQLSKQWGLDRYRVAALEKILNDKALPEDCRPLVIDEIKKRSKILADGAQKRGNVEMFNYFQNKI